MERNVAANTPFFLYYPITQIHFPTLAHPDFAGKTGAGDIGDSMADVDLQRRGSCSTRSASSASNATRSCSGAPTTARKSDGRGAASSGPWSGFYNTRDGRRHSYAVHCPMDRANSGRAGVERNRAPDRLLPDDRRGSRRRHRAEGSRDRWREPVAVLRRASRRRRIANTSFTSLATTVLRAP